MIKNYLKIAGRHLSRHKTFSLINILGLSIGIAACLLIFLYVHYETTYDQYNTHFDRIARITITLHAPESDLDFATSPYPLSDLIRREYPEVASAFRIEPSPVAVSFRNQLFREANFYKADERIFSVFTFSFLAGSPREALRAPQSLVLTRQVAQKYFGTPREALGKSLVCNGQAYRVTGVVADRPANSDLKIEGLFSTDFSAITSWVEDDLAAYTFVLFRKKVNLKAFARKLDRLAKQYIQPELDRNGALGYHAGFSVEALADVHYSKGKIMDTPKGNRRFNDIFSILAVFILVIALLNYINLTIARATERAKETGIRKVVGGRPLQLIGQFLTESFFLIAMAWLIALGITLLLLPYFGRLLDTPLYFSWRETAGFLVAIFLGTTILAGGYPAFVLSRYRPVNILKGNPSAPGRGGWLWRGITVIQFVIAIVLMSATTIIYRQVHYMTHKDPGFTRDRIAIVRTPADSVYRSTVHAFYTSLGQLPEVEGMTVGNGIWADDMPIASTQARVNGQKRELVCNYFLIDPEFIPLLHIRLQAGRNLSDSIATDRREGFLVNEAFVRAMGWSSAIGQRLEGFGHQGRVVGVVKDFYYKSLHNLAEPLVLIYNTLPVTSVTIKIRPRDIPAVNTLWRQFFPGKIFDYAFLDKTYAAQYRKDEITLHLFNDFTLLAIFISCLGLYGLVSLITARRIKEIGIRKLLGASPGQLAFLLGRGFLQLLLIAALIALPIAGFLTHRWLEGYAYHIGIRGWMYVLPVLLTGLIALAVSGGQVIRAARANPVKALKAEG